MFEYMLHECCNSSGSRDRVTENLHGYRRLQLTHASACARNLVCRDIRRQFTGINRNATTCGEQRQSLPGHRPDAVPARYSCRRGTYRQTASIASAAILLYKGFLHSVYIKETVFTCNSPSTTILFLGGRHRQHIVHICRFRG